MSVLSRNESTETKGALLEAAAALFAERGFETVSLREITGRAGANVSSVKYHFGSREGLVDAVVVTMAEPVNEERLRCLDELEKRGDFGLREVIEAFFEPLFAEIRRSPLSERLFCQLMGRLMGERPYQFPEEVMGKFREVAERFVAAFLRVCPELTAEEVFWRIHFSFGVLSATLMHGDLLRSITEGAVGDEELSETLKRVIQFCEGGFRA